MTLAKIVTCVLLDANVQRFVVESILCLLATCMHDCRYRYEAHIGGVHTSDRVLILLMDLCMWKIHT